MSNPNPANKTISIVISCILFTITIVSTTFALGVGSRLPTFEKRLKETESAERGDNKNIEVILSLITDVKESQKRVESLLLQHITTK